MTTTDRDTTVETVRALVDNAVDDAFTFADADHARSWQKEPGLSESGKCERAAGYAHHRVEWSDPVPVGKAALLGGWIHDGFLPWLAMALGADLVEQIVRLDGVLGHLDIGGESIVVDLKTKTESGPSRARTYGPKRNELWQVTGYAAALVEQGRTIRHIAIVYLDRGRGEHYTWVDEFRPLVADELRTWWMGVLNAPDPDYLPRGYRGPGVSIECDSCPWRTRCWGPQQQKVLLAEAEDPLDYLGEVLADYRDALDRKTDAERDQEFYGVIFDGIQRGVYGEHELKYQPTGERVDVREAVRLLEEHGIEVPRTKSKQSPRVRKVKGNPEPAKPKRTRKPKSPPKSESTPNSKGSPT